MKDVRDDELVRLSFRRELTPEEESRLEVYFAAHPDERAKWEEERELSRAVQALPDVPLSSNFTARVLRALDAEDARDRRQQRRRNWFRIPLPRWSWTFVAAVLAFFGAYEWRATKQAHMVAELQNVSQKLAGLPAPNTLEDFEAINQLPLVAADDELLKAFQ
jgi:anti-sigma factor RsiW